MITKKNLSRLLTICLAAGIAVAIYDSAIKHREQKASDIEEQSSPVPIIQEPQTRSPRQVKRAEIKEPLLGYSLKNRTDTRASIPAEKETFTAPSPKAFFDGKLSEESTLHMIGVYEGEPEAGKEEPPWWANCVGKRDDPKAMAECHRKYAGVHHQYKVSVKISYNKTPIVLALAAYEPVLWSIDQYADVEIEGVILAGYHQQQIIGLPSKIPIIAYTYMTPDCENCNRGEGYFYAYKKDNKFAKASVRLFEITGRNISSFQGAYKARVFNLNNNSD